MRTVIDCSTAVKWEINEPDSGKALRLRNECRRGTRELLAPDLFPIEVANAFYAAELRGDIAPGHFAARLADVMLAGPTLYHSTALLPRASIIIRKATTRIAIYDCLYVALAEREGCEMVTADRKLLNALGCNTPSSSRSGRSEPTAPVRHQPGVPREFARSLQPPRSPGENFTEPGLMSV